MSETRKFLRAYVVMLIVVVTLILLLWAFLGDEAWAHPGRLDAQGCHTVHARFVYQDGRVLEADTRHCHRSPGLLSMYGEYPTNEPEKSETEPSRHVMPPSTEAP